MKMSVRTSFSSGRPRAFAFTRGRGFTRGCGKHRVRADAAVRPRGRGSPRAWTRARAEVAQTRGRPTSAQTRVDTRRAATGPRGHGGGVRVSPIKGGALPLFPRFQPSPVE
jgi:hypothetical protein